MKALPLSLCCLAGAILGGAGVIAKNLQGARYNTQLDTVGAGIAVVALILTAVVIWTKPQE